MKPLPNYAEDATVTIDINVFDSNNEPGALTGTLTEAVEVYKSGSSTPHTAKYTPSVLNSLTGVYRVTIDMSAHAFFEVGKDYTAILTGAGISASGTAVTNTIIGRWSCENQSALIPDNHLDADKFAAETLLGATDVTAAVWDASRASYADAGTFGEGVASVIGGINTGSGTVTTLDGLDTNLSNDIAALNDLDSSAVTAACASALTTYDPPTRTEATADKDAILAALPSSGPSAAAIADAVLDETLADHSTAGSVGKAIIDALADTNELQSDWTNGGRLDLILDGVAAGGSAPTVEEIVDGLLDEPVASHATAGSVGAAIGASSTTETRDLEPVQHVWRFSRRSGGDIVAGNVLNIAPGETIRAGFECAASIVLPAGSVLATMTAATPSSGDVIATKLGIDATQAKVSIVCADDATTGETHYVRCEVTNSLGGGPLVLLGPVTVRAEPS